MVIKLIYLTTVPSNPVQNVMVSNVTDEDTVAVMISWDPPENPNGFIRYYRIEFQQTVYGSGSGIDSNGCPSINMTIMEERVLYNGTTEAPTMIILDELG